MAVTVSQQPGTLLVEFFRRFLLRLPLFALDAVFFLLLFALYFLGRGYGPDRPGIATENAERLISLQKSLFIWVEPGMHQWAREHSWLIEGANLTYMHLHLPLIAVMGVVFFLRDMHKYRVLRNTLIISGFLAIPIYHLFPLAPPRLLDLNGVQLGFLDTVGSMRTDKADNLTNNYAAMPSYHFGWIMLVAMGVWWCFKAAWARALAITFLAWMSYCIIVTANHYILDMVGGGIMIVIAFYLARRWERFLEGRPKLERKAFFTRRFWGEKYRVPF